ncbi:MAG TPA: hypothetical protein VIL08_02645 [Limnochorda sp.]
MVKVYTGSLRLLRLRQDPDLLDVTIKTGRRTFAPSWEIVMGHKRGVVSDEAYIRRYLAMLRESYRRNRSEWEELLGRERVVLACYCVPGARFCHRYILAEVLERLGAEMGQEIVAREASLSLLPIPRLAAPYLRPRSEGSTEIARS